MIQPICAPSTRPRRGGRRRERAKKDRGGERYSAALPIREVLAVKSAPGQGSSWCNESGLLLQFPRGFR
jgi:hypothetical protein